MQMTVHILLDGWLGGGRMVGMGRGLFFPGGLFTLLATIGLILLLFWAFRVWSGNRQTPAMAGEVNLSGGPLPFSTPPVTPAMATTPLDVIQLRYAKGELSRTEYETMREDLRRDWPAEGDAATASASIPVAEEVEPAVVDESESETLNQAELREEPKNPEA